MLSSLSGISVLQSSIIRCRVINSCVGFGQVEHNLEHLSSSSSSLPLLSAFDGFRCLWGLRLGRLRTESCKAMKCGHAQMREASCFTSNIHVEPLRCKLLSGPSSCNISLGKGSDNWTVTA